MCKAPSHPRTYIQNHGDASTGFRGEELVLGHGHLLLAGGVLSARHVLVVAHFGDDPADEPVESNGLGAAVSGLRCRLALAVFTGFGFGLFAAVVGSKFGLFFVEQFVDSVPTIARCLLTHPFDVGRSCCAVERGGEAPPPSHPPPISRYITAPAPETRPAACRAQRRIGTGTLRTLRCALLEKDF